jgi:hypothetical protein
MRASRRQRQQSPLLNASESRGEQPPLQFVFAVSLFPLFKSNVFLLVRWE